MWGLRLGLSFSWAKGIKKLITEVDFLLVFQWLMLHEETTSRNYNLLAVCRELLSNQLADGLSRFGRCQHIGFHVEWLTLQALVEEAMQRDKMCYKWPRLVLNFSSFYCMYGVNPPPPNKKLKKKIQKQNFIFFPFLHGHFF